MSVFIDSNIYVYALDAETGPMRELALRVTDWHFARYGVISRQVLGEILNVAHRKRQLSVDAARAWVSDVESYATVFATDERSLADASLLAERYQLQFWDAVICTVARRNGAALLLSEDMHDGLRLGTMSILNPFALHNRDVIEELLTS